VLFAGCATSMPVSEVLVFSEQQIDESASFSDKIESTLGTSVSYILPSNNLKNDSLDTIKNEYLYATPMPSFSVSYSDKISLGSTVPLFAFWQVDGTVKLVDDYFVTISKKIYLRNTEIILQKKIKEQESGGISLGIFFRNDAIQLTESEDIIFSQTFYVPWYGVRTVFQKPIKFGYEYFLRGFINAGYSSEYNSPIASFGFSIGIISGANKKRRKPPSIPFR